MLLSRQEVLAQTDILTAALYYLGLILTLQKGREKIYFDLTKYLSFILLENNLHIK